MLNQYWPMGANSHSRESVGGQSPVQAWIADVQRGILPSNLAKWSSSFRQLREMYPNAVMRACIRHLGQTDFSPVTRVMAAWLSTDEKYVPVLLDSEFLSLAEAKRAAFVLKNLDTKFFLRLSRLIGEKEWESESVCRALDLLTGVGDSSVLVPWLRKLSTHANEKIRSKAVKALCEIRSNRSLIERHLGSEDPRTRANAIEAIWHVHNSDTLELFRAALSDPHHRVVVNALVGLYNSKDPQALKMIIDLAGHPSPMFRAATVWALGHIADPEGIPVLKTLAEDPVPTVRTKALQALPELEARIPVVANKPEPPPVEPAPVEKREEIRTVEQEVTEST
jgi:HEAT repeat protein